MARDDSEKIPRTTKRRLPAVSCPTTIFWLHDPTCLQSDEDWETFDESSDEKNYHIFQYSSVSKCIKHLKCLRSSDRIVIASMMDIRQHASRFRRYPQLYSILVLLPEHVDASTVFLDGMHVSITTFHDPSSMLVRLKQLIAELTEYDDAPFVAYNEEERSLHDLREELGLFVWGHSYKGEYLPIAVISGRCTIDSLSR